MMGTQGNAVCFTETDKCRPPANAPGISDFIAIAMFRGFHRDSDALK